MEPAILLGLLGFVLAVLAGVVIVFRGLLRHWEQKEIRFLKLISNLADRIQAKDLAGYMAVQAENPNATAPQNFSARDDGTEARIEAIRTGRI